MLEIGQLGAYGACLRTAFNGFDRARLVEVRDRPMLGGEAAPQGSARLERVGFRLPDAGAVDALAERLRRAGQPFTREGGVLEVRDPSGTRLSFTA